MVDLKTTVQTRGRDPAAVASVNENPRNSKRKRRMEILKNARKGKDTVRVVPANENLRGVLKHMPSGIAFRKEGGTEWPNDRFTQRRLRDGSVRLEKEKKQEDDGQPQEQDKRKPQKQG